MTAVQANGDSSTSQVLALTEGTPLRTDAPGICLRPLY